MLKMEERLRSLQKEGQNPLLAQLMKLADENEERNIRHRKRLQQIKGLIQADLADLGHRDSTAVAAGHNDTLQPQCSTTDASSHSEPDSLDHMLGECTGETMILPCNDDLNIGGQAPSIDDCGGIAPEADTLLWDQDAHTIGSDHLDELIIVPGQDPCQSGRSRKLWDEVEQLLSRAQPTGGGASADNEEVDMHIIINAVSRGWSQFSQVANVDTRWSCLRNLDERYFSRGYGQVERLAVLTIASQLLDGKKVKSSAASKLLPQFIKPRPSQEAIPHSPIADFYVWPGFRERLTVCPQYSNDTFLHAMYFMFQFRWPYSLKATYNVDPQTGLSHFSPQFLEHLGDLRCWTMNSDFLIQYPDFRGDIPIFNAGPSNLGLLNSSISYPDWYNFDSAEEEKSHIHGSNLQLATLVGYETDSNPNAFHFRN
ncbi:hypothetical protein H2204_006826 [Knufia peltigerae]|uniref:Uncharacterized protein n=1 Tax=Knufia peltigerae TaxID=1002370 RepID=A0AA38Y352_9EURO|nr:hypothetical protein H2204_006826 [Knufia peltigerae]